MKMIGLLGTSSLEVQCLQQIYYYISRSSLSALKLVPPLFSPFIDFYQQI